MSAAAGEIWPWLLLAGLGAYHGVNPGMGWLFAVALGLHRGSRRAVLMALLPIGAGHAAAVGAIVLLVTSVGRLVDAAPLRRAGGAVLIAWAAYHLLYGHRHRVRVGMQAGSLGLFVWSFLMATAHGAGLMLLPALEPLQLLSSAGDPVVPAAAGGHAAHGGAGALPAADSVAVALGAVGVHSLTMLLTTGAIAVVVYQWFDLAFLRRGWINLDLIWSAALIAAGAVLWIA